MTKNPLTDINDRGDPSIGGLQENVIMGGALYMLDRQVYMGAWLFIPVPSFYWTAALGWAMKTKLGPQYRQDEVAEEVILDIGQPYFSPASSGRALLAKDID